jgi:hypothetical protein
MRPIPKEAISDHDFIFVETKRYSPKEVKDSDFHYYVCNKCKTRLCVIENPEFCIKTQHNSLALEQGWYYDFGTYAASYEAQKMLCIDWVIKDIIK